MTKDGAESLAYALAEQFVKGYGPDDAIMDPIRTTLTEWPWWSSQLDRINILSVDDPKEVMATFTVVEATNKQGTPIEDTWAVKMTEGDSVTVLAFIPIDSTDPIFFNL